jgi:hypothetical protein
MICHPGRYQRHTVTGQNCRRAWRLLCCCDFQNRASYVRSTPGSRKCIQPSSHGLCCDHPRRTLMEVKIVQAADNITRPG